MNMDKVEIYRAKFIINKRNYYKNFQEVLMKKHLFVLVIKWFILIKIKKKMIKCPLSI